MPRQTDSDLPSGGRQRHHLKAWRKFRRMTQRQVADILGEHPSSISQLESGKQGYTQWKLESLARIYRTDPASLLSVDPSLQPGPDEELRRVWVELRNGEKHQALGHLKLIRESGNNNKG